jgi:transposase
MIEKSRFDAVVSELAETKIIVAKLQFQLDQFLRAVHGTKSEKLQPILSNMSSDAPELPFGEEIKQEAEPETKSITVTRTHRKKENPPSRSEIPAHLDRVVSTIEPAAIPEGAVKIGELVTEQLEYQPGKIFVKKTVRPKYAFADKSGVIVAPMPWISTYKCMAGASLLMRILVDKHVDHLPLYRQQQRFKRDGMNIPASTLSGWVKLAAELLEPLYDLLVEQVLASSYIGADETHMNVLDKKIKGKTHHGYFWVYLAHQEKLTFFDYDATRAQGVPGEKLKTFKGHLQSDGYVGYKQFKENPDITWMCCWAHARRKFEAAMKNDLKRSEYVLGKIQRLYRLEHWIRILKVSPEKIVQLRQNIATPILEGLNAWMLETIVDPKVPPSSPIADAIKYTLKLWKELTVYTTDHRLYIDNNPVENKIRPVAIGRKNYLFMGSHKHAQYSAMLYSFFASCALNGINPEHWLQDVIEKIGSTSKNEYYKLLPNHWGKSET